MRLNVNHKAELEADMFLSEIFNVERAVVGLLFIHHWLSREPSAPDNY